MTILGYSHSLIEDQLQATVFILLALHSRRALNTGVNKDQFLDLTVDNASLGDMCLVTYSMKPHEGDWVCT